MDIQTAGSTDASDDPIQILMVDDDPDDCLLLTEAMREVRLINAVKFCHDGIEAMSYLNRTGEYENLKGQPYPGLILLDLNMPKKDGREVLAEIKSDPNLRSIPVVILTTSKAEKDLLSSYDLGANSFIVKPVSFDKLVESIKVVTDYWFQIVRLPSSY